MNDTTNSLRDPADPTVPAAASDPLVELFDPPLCCPTGLCGPTLDQTLLDANEMVLALKAGGVGVERYQMASHPHIFLRHPEVMRLVRERGMDAFPITAIAGRVIKVGAYPSREEIDLSLLDREGNK
jgi:hypothetical protein